MGDAPSKSPRDSRFRVGWTEALDAELRKLRWEGLSWDQIGVALGLSRWCTIERGRKIGAQRCPPELRQKNAPEARRADVGRGMLALPPGHASTWKILVKGTSLEGADYAPPP